MEFITLFIGLILGLMLRDLKLVLKCMLCLLSVYVALRIVHSDITFPEIINLDFKYLFSDSKLWTEGITYFLISIGVFYWALPKFLHNYVESIISKISIAYDKINIERDYKRSINIGLKIGQFITKIIPTRRVKKELDLNADILADRYIDYFSIITHLCCITPFFIKNMFLLLVIVLFISLILFFALPYVIVLFDKIVQYTDSVIEKGNN